MDYFNASKIGFLVLTAICISLICLRLYKTGHKSNSKSPQRSVVIFILILTTWIMAVFAMAKSGFIADFSSLPPRMVLVILPPLVGMIILTRSKRVTDFLNNVSFQEMMYIQAFRIPVEIFLWWLFLDGKISERMSFEGWNYDVLVGITGPVMAVICFGQGRYLRKLAIIWNILGLILLANIVVISVLSFPTPFQVFYSDIKVTVMTTWPTVLLPAVLVPLAYYMHALSLKKLLNTPSR